MMAGCSNSANWAVRVSPHMETEHDILEASPSLLESSPSPFGLGICTFQGLSNASPQRLFYVSEKAAQDRAPEKHAMNGVGVRPGWYMIGEKGMFHIHAGPVKRTEYAERSANGFVVSVKVDGQDTHNLRIYKKEGGIVRGFTSIWHGFTKRCLVEPGARMISSKVDQFCFEDILDALEGKDVVPTETGTISMLVSTGNVVNCSTSVQPCDNKYSYSKQEISAKTVAREGRCIRVGSSGCKAVSGSLPDWNVISIRDIKDARVNVFVRSRHWLRSRRVIDDYDEPFKYVNLVKARNAYDVAGKKRVQVVSLVDDNIRPKKRRHEVNKVGVEIIDLT